MVTGYHLGVLNTSLTWVAADLDFQVTTAGAVVVSAVIVGAVFGSLFAGQFADAVGPGTRVFLWLSVLHALAAFTNALDVFALAVLNRFGSIAVGSSAVHYPKPYSRQEGSAAKSIINADE